MCLWNETGFILLILNKTVAMLEDAAAAMKQIAKSGKKDTYLLLQKNRRKVNVAEAAAELEICHILLRDGQVVY